jgi:hypothetical protein
MFTDPDENEFFMLEKVSLKERVNVIEKKQRMMQPGKSVFKVLLKNDSYKGFDKSERVEIITLREEVVKEKRRNINYDDEDVQAVRQGSLMQQMMEMGKENDSDDEEEEEEEVKKEGKLEKSEEKN